MTTTGRRWQEWAGFALGLWLAVSPWTAGYTDYPAATTNAAFLGIALALGSHFQAALGECRGQWVSLAAGLWLVAAPFYLGYASGTATAAAVCVGLFMVALAASALIGWRRQEAHLR